jgi:ketosteroid isomerase-like protein
MRNKAVLLGLAALTWSVGARADVAADIRAQEAAWEKAFRTGDHGFLQSLLSPGFTLMRAENGQILFTRRAQWFANLQGYIFHEFEARVVDVAVDGDTAVATVEGRWKVGIPGRGTRQENFILSDTWVRRNGIWQVLYRHSTPQAPGQPQQPSTAQQERGR